MLLLLVACLHYHTVPAYIEPVADPRTHVVTFVYHPEQIVCDTLGK